MNFYSALVRQLFVFTPRDYAKVWEYTAADGEEIFLGARMENDGNMTLNVLRGYNGVFYQRLIYARIYEDNSVQYRFNRKQFKEIKDYLKEVVELDYEESVGFLKLITGFGDPMVVQIEAVEVKERTALEEAINKIPETKSAFLDVLREMGLEDEELGN